MDSKREYEIGEAGYQAGMMGKIDNPYELDTPEYEAWKEGNNQGLRAWLYA